ncbi:MAG TPA: O-antigen ligase family protein [Bryobacteraceae bacterium]|nr:O-antigen ligase family protein [Bryobacteraceae bacterium]
MNRRPLLDRVAWALLVVFVFSVPFEKALQIPGVGTASRLLGLLAFVTGAAVVTIGAIQQRRAARAPNLLLVLGTLFTAWSGATVLWSLAPSASAARFLTFAQLLAMAWLVWELCRTARQQDWLLGAYVAGAALASVATIVRFALNRPTYWRRYAASGFDPNDLGLTVALSIPLALYLALKFTDWRRYALWAAMALADGAILLSGSRTSLVAGILAFIFAAWRWRESALTARVAAVILFLALLLGPVGLAPAASRERLSTLHTELTKGTLHGRTRIWKAGLKAFKQRPIIGVGAGAYPVAVKPRLGVPAIPGHEYVAHNAFLSVLVEEGLVGFGLFGLMLAVAVVFAWVMPDRDRALWLIMLLVWGIGVSTLTWEQRKPTWLLFALLTTAWARSFREDK